MNNPLTQCPDSNTLTEFLLGKLSEQHSETCEKHISDCGPCIETIRGLSLDDTLNGLVSAASSNDTEQDDEDSMAIQKLVERMRGLGFPDSISPHSPSLSDRAIEVQSLLEPPVHADDLGQVGKYRILELVGVGSTGVVYKALDDDLKRPVALKFLRPSLGELARKRFMAEARATASLFHPNIVQILEVGEHGPTAFIAMTWEEGQTLEQLLEQHETIPPDDCVPLGKRLAEALQHAHQRGLVHRDIKPANIWIPDEGGFSNCKILDFGLARVTDEDPQLTCTGLIAGTPCYMSPEQSRGRQLDARSDLFSLGCVLYRALTGQLPFRADNALSTLQSIQRDQPADPRELNPEVHHDLSDLVMCLLEKSPSSRPATATSVAEAFESPAQRWDFKPKSRQRIRKVNSDKQRSSSKFSIVIALLLAVGLFGMAMFMPQVIRIINDQGELVIETEVDDVQIEVLKDGNQIEIIDLATEQSITIQSGEYSIRPLGNTNSIELDKETLKLLRGGKEIVKVTRRKLPLDANGSNAKPIDLAWSQPADPKSIPLTFTPAEPSATQPGPLKAVVGNRIDLKFGPLAPAYADEPFTIPATIKNNSNSVIKNPTAIMDLNDSLEILQVSSFVQTEWTRNNSLSLMFEDLQPGEIKPFVFVAQPKWAGSRSNVKIQWIDNGRVGSDQINFYIRDREFEKGKLTQVDNSVASAKQSLSNPFQLKLPENSVRYIELSIPVRSIEERKPNGFITANLRSPTLVELRPKRSPGESQLRLISDDSFYLVNVIVEPKSDLLQAGDVLEVLIEGIVGEYVAGTKFKTAILQVDSNGMLSLPLIPEISVAGKSVEQLEELINQNYMEKKILKRSPYIVVGRYPMKASPTEIKTSASRKTSLEEKLRSLRTNYLTQKTRYEAGDTTIQNAQNAEEEYLTEIIQNGEFAGSSEQDVYEAYRQMLKLRNLQVKQVQELHDQAVLNGRNIEDLSKRVFSARRAQQEASRLLGIVEENGGYISTQAVYEGLKYYDCLKIMGKERSLPKLKQAATGLVSLVGPEQAREAAEVLITTIRAVSNKRDLESSLSRILYKLPAKQICSLALMELNHDESMGIQFHRRVLADPFMNTVRRDADPKVIQTYVDAITSAATDRMETSPETVDRAIAEDTFKIILQLHRNLSLDQLNVEKLTKFMNRGRELVGKESTQAFHRYSELYIKYLDERAEAINLLKKYYEQTDRVGYYAGGAGMGMGGDEEEFGNGELPKEELQRLSLENLFRYTDALPDSNWPDFLPLIVDYWSSKEFDQAASDGAYSPGMGGMDLGGGAGAGMGMGMPKRNPMFDQKIADIIRKRLKLESTVAFRSKLIDLANRMKEDKKFADKESAVQRSQIMLELAQEIGSKPSKQ